MGVIDNKKLAVKHLLKRYLQKKENVLLSERFFAANRILNWIFSHTSEPRVIIKYINDLEKFIEGELTLDWIEQVAFFKESRDNNDYCKKQEASVEAEEEERRKSR